MMDDAHLFRESDHGPDCRCEGGVMFAIEVTAERGVTVDELSRMLVDEELVDLATEQVRRGDQDWDMNRVRLWIAMLRVGDVVGSRL